jgi:molybdopterin/thiamine biosynthesis adenylyltransferase
MRSIEQDRGAHLVIGADPGLDFDEARLRLERATVVISAGAAAGEAWGQAALLTIAECAVRMFRGGVYLARDFAEPVVVGCRPPVPLQRFLTEIGCHREAAPAHALALHVGADVPEKVKVLCCWADGWIASVSPRPGAPTTSGNEISGALAGAMMASEAFRSQVLKDLRAGRRTLRISALTPSDPEPVAAMTLERLPARCWLLGLGNLGQATLWLLGLLPYADPGAVELFLQDGDAVGPENLDVQLLTRFAWIGRKKARAAAYWAEAQGFRTTIIERRFTTGFRRMLDEPGLIFVGVDNLETRRAAAAEQGGFDLVLDGGLGATPAEVFDIRLHGFPGSRTPQGAWPPATVASGTLPGMALSRLVEQGRLPMCGALRITGQAVGVPSTAVAAAAIAVAQACRAISSAAYCDLVDLSLADPKRAASREHELPRPGVLPVTEARARSV